MIQLTDPHLIEIVVVVVLAAWALGRSILTLIQALPCDVVHRVFLSLGTGIGVLTSSFAIVRSGGKTVMLPALLLLLIGLFWLASKPHHLKSFRVAQQEWLLLVEATLVCLGWSLLIFQFMKGDAGELLYLAPQQDSAAYARLTSFLDEFGIETSMPDWLDPASAVRSPYHFADVWLAALVRRFFGVPSSAALGCVSSAALLTLSYLVLRLLLNQLFGLQLPSWAGRIAALGATGPGPGVLIPQVIGEWHYLSGIDLFSRSMVTANKLLPPLVLICYATFWALNSRTRVAAIFALIGAALVDFTFAPFVAIASLIVLLEVIRRRDFDALKWSLGAIACSAIATIGYVVEARQASSVPRILYDRFLEEYAPTTASYLITAFNVFAGSLIRLSLIGVFFVIIFSVPNRRHLLAFASPNPRVLSRWGTASISAFGGMSASVIAWSILHDIFDSVQLVTNVATVLSCCATAVAIGSLFRRECRRRTLSAGLGVLLVALSASLTARDLKARRDAFSSEYSIEFLKSARTFFETRSGFGLHFRARSAFVYDNLGSFSIHILGTSNVTTALARSGYEIIIPFEGMPISSEPRMRSRQRSMLSYAPLYKFIGEENFDVIAEEKTVLSFLRSVPATHAVFEGVDSLPSTWGVYASGCINDIRSRTLLCEWQQPDQLR